MLMAEPTFLVDKKGLSKILARRGKEFIVTELIQNCWDEAGVTEVKVTFNQADGRASLMVEDDAPEGFADLSHAYTLFAESRKKGNAEQRGRFNLGEKLVIAICDMVKITTTKGTVVFDDEGRKHGKEKREHGTLFAASLRMNKDEAAALRALAESCISPRNIATIFNGSLLGKHIPDAQCFETLPTEVADDEGYLKPTQRKTTIHFYPVAEGEKAMLYEMGIPVVETGDQWHVNVHQKVPLNSDRDNVTPSYLQKIRTITLNHMADLIKPEQATATWIAAALEDPKAETEAVKAIIEARFGKKVVISDPSDPEGTKMAVAAGYTVIQPRSFNHEQWVNVKAAGVLPAGQVTPSPKVYAENGRPESVIPVADWTQDMILTVGYASQLAQALIGRTITVKIVREPQAGWDANYGPHAPLTLNYSALGKKFFASYGSAAQLALFLHEFAHDRISDHLSIQFADEVARLGAALAMEGFSPFEGRLNLIKRTAEALAHRG